MHTSYEKPYDRFLAYGPTALTDAELLAIILRTGHEGRDAVALAKEILALSGGDGLAGLYHTSLEQLQEIKGIGEVKAVQIKCITELSRRITHSKRGKRPSFTSAEAFADYFMDDLRFLEKERSLCIFLDASMQLIKYDVISIGTVNASICSSRDIFIEALKHKAVNLVLMHNHPSGNPTPSRQDFHITRKIMEAGKLLDIPLVDHIIIGDNIFYSMRENGHMRAE